jgi:uncharacterized circularly permuted ATP-grasp superfamily protein
MNGIVNAKTVMAFVQIISQYVLQHSITMSPQSINTCQETKSISALHDGIAHVVVTGTSGNNVKHIILNSTAMNNFNKSWNNVSATCIKQRTSFVIYEVPCGHIQVQPKPMLICFVCKI